MKLIKGTEFKQRQSGFSLAIALILLVPLTLLAVTVAKRSGLEEMMAGSQRDGSQAMMNADSGLEFADQIFDEIVGDTHNYTISDYLDPIGKAGVLYYDGTTALTAYSLGEGTVTVTIRDNDDGDGDTSEDIDNVLIVRSVGNFQGAERIVEGIFTVQAAAAPSSSNLPPLTIFSEDDLKISGNPNIFGPDSLVHSNANINISGTLKIDGEVQQTGTGGGGNIKQGDYNSSTGRWSNLTTVGVTKGATAMATPYVYPPIYKPAATRYLLANCDVWDGDPYGVNPITGNASQKIGNAKDGRDGWKCDNDGSKNKFWELEGDSTSNGFYYVEGNLKINGNPGEGSSAVCLSVVAEGFIEVSGNPNIVPYYTCGSLSLDFDDAAFQAQADLIDDEDARAAVLASEEVLLFAGGDLKINGNASQHFNGIMAAHDDFQISGEPRLQGAIIAENAKYSGESAFFGNIDSGERKSDTVDFNEINGNPDIFGNSDLGGLGDPGSPVVTGVTLEAWRELVEQ